MEKESLAWDVGIFLPRKKQSKEVSRAGRRRKQAGIQGQWQQESRQRVPGTSKMLPRYGLQRTNGEERLHRLEEWDMGRVEGNLQEKDESLRMGLRQDK